MESANETIDFHQCFDSDYNFDPYLYSLYINQVDEIETMEDVEFENYICNDYDKTYHHPAKKKRIRSIQKHVIECIDDDGNKIIFLPEQSQWYNLYVLYPKLDSEKFTSSFRQRFRLPYSQYLELLSMVKESIVFKRWLSKDAIGKKSSPIELLVLGSLRYLGRGWTFDDLFESTGISFENHRQFFHIFINFGATTLYKKYVVQPTTALEAESHTREYSVAGLPGCVGSMDATHVCMERCSHRIKQMHSGPKLSLPARSYNIIANHRRLILSSTGGHPARYNDKTLVLFDSLARPVQKGNLLSDVKFELYARNDTDDIIQVKYTGAWFITDNGYLNWPTTVPPFKDSCYEKEIKWSKWIESMRKDVECTFGILKGRWRILKTGVRLHSVKATDNVWKTCCALHNWLLNVDGLNDQLDHSVNEQSSDWEGMMGRHSYEDVIQYSKIPSDIINERSTASICDYDVNHDESVNFGYTGMDEEISEMMKGIYDENDTIFDTFENEETNESRPIIVKNLTLKNFRDKLVTHFDIASELDLITWPTRNKIT